MPESAWKNVRGSFKSEEEKSLTFMFPAKSRFEQLQMLGDNNQRSVMPWSVLGVFRRLYGSKVLAYVQEEFNINRIALDRQGRFEGRDIVTAKHAASESGEKD